MTVPESDPAAAAEETPPAVETPPAPADAAGCDGESIAESRPGGAAAAVRRFYSRRPVIVAAVSTVAVVAVAALVAGIVVVVGSGEADPEDVVAEYLDTVRSGDAEAALEHVPSSAELAGPSLDLLAAKAMDAEWDFTVVREHSSREDFATVDVDIVAGDGTSRQGRFELERADADAEWTIRNPLVQLSTSGLPLRFSEFNGAVSQDEVVWLFPGVYAPYPSLSGRVSFSASTYVAAPSATATPEGSSPGLDWEMQEEFFLPSFTVSQDFEAELHAQLEDWIDDCAASGDLSPQDCPFSAGAIDGEEARVGGDEYRVDEVEWKPIEYPAVTLAADEGHFHVYVTVPGEIQVSGEGESQDGVEEFRGACSVDFSSRASEQDGEEPADEMRDGVKAAYSADGEFRFSQDGEARNTC